MVIIENTQISSNIPWWHNPPKELLPSIQLKTFKRGDRILKSGEEIQYMYVIDHGKVRVYEEMLTGDIGRVVQLTVGDLVGEMETISGYEKSVYSATVEDDGTVLLQITPSDFLSWIEKDHLVCLKLIRTLSNKMYSTSSWLSHYALGDAMSLIANYLYETAHEALQTRPIFRVGDTRKEIAEDCRISERTVNRKIVELSNKGLVSISKGKIEITQKQLNEIMEWTKNEKDNFGL